MHKMRNGQVHLRLVLVQKRTCLEFRVCSRVLIYMGASQHAQSLGLQVQRDASSLSKYAYKRGHSDQEVFGELVSIDESKVRKSGMSHGSYGKQEERNRNKPYELESVIRGTARRQVESETESMWIGDDVLYR